MDASETERRLHWLEQSHAEHARECARRNEELARWQARLDEKMGSYERVKALGYVLFGIVGGAILIALLKVISPSLADTLAEHLTWR